MEVIDVILTSILAYGFIKGFIKGFVVEIISLVAIYIAFYIAIQFSYPIKNFLIHFFEFSPRTAAFFAFIMVMIVITIGLIVGGKVVSKMLVLVALGPINKILGSFFGALKLAILLSVFIFVFEKFNHSLQLVSKQTTETSLLYQPIQKIAPYIYPSIIETFKTISNEPNNY